MYLNAKVIANKKILLKKLLLVFMVSQEPAGTPTLEIYQAMQV